MTPEFFRCFMATSQTNAFVEGGRVIDYVRQFQKKESLSRHQQWEVDFIYTVQQKMRTEIDQISFTSIPLMHTHLYEYLKSWVEYFNKGELLVNELKNNILRHNEKEEKEFNLFVQIEEDKFASAGDIDHLWPV